ncbi:MAG: hypothetical protein JW734_04440 [Candidatus Omnitrophica bacterium]|nr:hypothetical protein [Candidatus Omnitrophota bacterium]
MSLKQKTTQSFSTTAINQLINSSRFYQRLENKTKKILSKIIGLLIGVVLLAALTVYLILSNLSLKKSINSLSEIKKEAFNKRLYREKEIIKEGLEAVYNESMRSYESMADRLEQEKKRKQELQEELNNGS